MTDSEQQNVVVTKALLDHALSKNKKLEERGAALEEALEQTCAAINSLRREVNQLHQ